VSGRDSGCGGNCIIEMFREKRHLAIGYGGVVVEDVVVRDRRRVIGKHRPADAAKPEHDENGCVQPDRHPGKGPAKPSDVL